jgi:hypothetical protein
MRTKVRPEVAKTPRNLNIKGAFCPKKRNSLFSTPDKSHLTHDRPTSFENWSLKPEDKTQKNPENGARFVT